MTLPTWLNRLKSRYQEGQGLLRSQIYQSHCCSTQLRSSIDPLVSLAIRLRKKETLDTDLLKHEWQSFLSQIHNHLEPMWAKAVEFYFAGWLTSMHSAFSPINDMYNKNAKSYPPKVLKLCVEESEPPNEVLDLLLCCHLLDPKAKEINLRPFLKRAEPIESALPATTEPSTPKVKEQTTPYLRYTIMISLLSFVFTMGLFALWIVRHW